MLLMGNQSNLYNIEDDEEGEHMAENAAPIEPGNIAEGVDDPSANASQLNTPATLKEGNVNPGGSITHSANKMFGHLSFGNSGE